MANWIDAGGNVSITTSPGYVGIGTANPGVKLDVAGGAGVDDGIRVTMGSIANLRLARSDATAQTWIVRTDSDRSFKIIDETAGGTPTRLAIDTAGNVIINGRTAFNSAGQALYA